MPITVQTSIPEISRTSTRDETVVTLGGMLSSYYGTRRESVASEDKSLNRERAAEST